MKKLLAILLAAAMLLSFGAVGAMALTPEEELEAEAWALIEQAKTFYSGSYTVMGTLTETVDNISFAVPMVYVSDTASKKQALQMDTFTFTNLVGLKQGYTDLTAKLTAFIFESLFGSTLRSLIIGDKKYTAHRHIYYPEPGTLFNPFVIHLYHDLEKAEVVEIIKDGEVLSITLAFPEDPSEDYTETFEFVGGIYTRCIASDVNGIRQEIVIDSYTEQVDTSYLSTKGMIRLPGILIGLLSRLGGSLI